MNLTKRDILDMESGRLLDKLVAEHVMGLEVDHESLPHYPKYYIEGYNRTYLRDVPNYSTDMNYAWEVLEKFDYATVRKINKGAYCNYVCRIESDDYEQSVPDKSAQLAICKTALLVAVGL